MIEENEIVATVKDVAERLNDLGINYMVTGSVALPRGSSEDSFKIIMSMLLRSFALTSVNRSSISLTIRHW